MNIDQLNNDSQLFLKEIFEELGLQNLKIESHWEIDHLCYRTVSEENYQKIKKDFSSFSTLLIESEVGARMISTFKLERPITFKNWNIWLVEVPAPKFGKTTREGLEHIEIVCDVSFDEIKKQFAGCVMDLRGLGKKVNPELEIEFKNFAIKFHHQSLDKVIEWEKKN